MAAWTYEQNHRPSANRDAPLSFRNNNDAPPNTLFNIRAEDQLTVVSSTQRRARMHRQRPRQGPKRSVGEHSVAANTVAGQCYQVPLTHPIQYDAYNPIAFPEWTATACGGMAYPDYKLSGKGSIPQQLALLRPQLTPGEAFDPFHITPTTIDADSYSVLRYWMRCHPPSNGSPRTGPKSNGLDPCKQPAVPILEQAFSNELCMNSILAVTASRMQHVDICRVIPCAIYIHKAIKAMQRTIDNTENLNSLHVFIMFQLYSAEAYACNLEGSLIHLRAAKAVADSLKNFQALDDCLSDSVLGGGEILLASKLTRKQEFPCAFDPGNAVKAGLLYYQSFTVDKAFGRLGQALLALTAQDLVNLDMQHIVKDMIEYTEIRQSTLDQKLIEPTVRRWLRLRSLTLRFRLMSLEAVPLSQIHALRVTLVMWLILLMVYIDNSELKRNVQIASLHLKEVLLQVKDSAWSKRPNFLAWILSVGAMSTEDTDQEDWFLGELATSLYASFDWNIGYETQLRELSERFFYLDDIQGASLRKLAVKLENSRNTSRILPNARLKKRH